MLVKPWLVVLSSGLLYGNGLPAAACCDPIPRPPALVRPSDRLELQRSTVPSPSAGTVSPGVSTLPASSQDTLPIPAVAPIATPPKKSTTPPEVKCCDPTPGR
jgi:hypothetical protein